MAMTLLYFIRTVQSAIIGNRTK